MSLPRNAGSFLGGGDWGGPSAGVVLGSACQPGCRIEGHVKHQGGVVVSGGERRGMGRKAFVRSPLSLPDCSVVLVHSLGCKPISLLVASPSLTAHFSQKRLFLTAPLTHWEPMSLSGRKQSAFVISYLLGLHLAESDTDPRALTGQGLGSGGDSSCCSTWFVLRSLSS